MYGGDNDDYFPDNTIKGNKPCWAGQHTSWVSEITARFWEKYIMPQKFDSTKRKKDRGHVIFCPSDEWHREADLWRNSATQYPILTVISGYHIVTCLHGVTMLTGWKPGQARALLVGIPEKN